MLLRKKSLFTSYVRDADDVMFTNYVVRMYAVLSFL